MIIKPKDVILSYEDYEYLVTYTETLREQRMEDTDTLDMLYEILKTHLLRLEDGSMDGPSSALDIIQRLVKLMDVKIEEDRKEAGDDEY